MNREVNRPEFLSRRTALAWAFGLFVLAGSVLRALDPARALKDFSVSEWQVTDGLPYPSIAAIAQSRDGYLWLGTRVGLARFNGATFTTFTTANCPELTDSRVTTFCEAPDGTLWIGTASGIAWYRDGKWQRPVLGKQLDEAEVFSIYVGESGDVFASAGGKLFRVRAGTAEEVLADGAPVPRMNAIRTDSAGNLLFAGRGLFRSPATRPGELVEIPGVGSSEQLALAIGRDDAWWVGSPNGLVSSNGGSPKTFSARDGLPSNAVRSLRFDRDGNLWIGTSNGLARLANGRFEQLFLHGVEPLSHVLSLYEDREKNLWVGTDNGLYRVRDVNVGNLTMQDGLPVNSTICVLEAKDHSRWVGTLGGGLVHFEARGPRVFRVADGLREDGIGGLAEDGSGGLWIAYYTRGVGYLKNNRITNYTVESVRSRGIGVDSHGGVWVANSAGLYRKEGEAFVRVALPSGVDRLRALHVDARDRVWAGGAGAVGCYDAGRWTIYPLAGLREDRNVQAIFSGSEGETWVVHDGPTVVRLRDGAQETFAFPPELGPLVYYGLEFGRELWINFRAGIARIPLAELDAVSAGRKSTPAFRLYNEPDGMRSRAPNNTGLPGGIATHDGQLWFSTSSGVAVIDPARIRTNPLPPPVVIERVEVDKHEYTLDQLARVPPGRGEIALQFAALSFVNPGQVRFKYRLQGFDPDWIDAAGRREAHYGGLPPGEYRFEVKASNNEGVWNEAGASCRIVLLPHFYQRWWFFALVGLAVAGSSAQVYRWRSRHLQARALRLQQENEKLEQRIAERTAELRQSYEALRASEYFYHSLVESLPQVIARKDAQGRYTYANAAFAELLGRPLEQIVGHTDAELYPPGIAAKLQADDRRVLELNQPLEYEEVVEKDGGPRRYLHVKKVALRGERGEPLGLQTLFWDMTVFRETEEKLKTAQREIVEISRLAGIAEMATGVLHNLGNALTSVKVAMSVAVEGIRGLGVQKVGRVGEMLAHESHRLAEYLATDERGAKLPGYITLLGKALEDERTHALKELKHAADGLEHVAQIVHAQQSNARVAGLVEEVSPAELLEYAWRMNEASLSRHGVSVSRDFMPAAPVHVQRQKAVQVLVNLVRNACDALKESGRPDKRLVLGLRRGPNGCVQLSVRDNGVGIKSENMVRIFEFGFTTKPNGHGFGLHSSALAAKELGGALLAQSDGPGQGATFTLELPCAPAAAGAEDVTTARDEISPSAN
jgi:PAS domain S-box-containing protein